MTVHSCMFLVQKSALIGQVSYETIDIKSRIIITMKNIEYINFLFLLNLK